MADTSAYASTFQLIDGNGDGLIDRAEFDRLLAALGGPELDGDVADSMFAGMDGDADGQVSLDELAAYLEANHA